MLYCALISPKLSRRIYARRASLAGLLIAATLFLLLLQGYIGQSMSLAIIAAAICFAALFTHQFADILAASLQKPFFASGIGRRCVFPAVIVLFPLLAPVLFAASVLQFLRSSG